MNTNGGSSFFGSDWLGAFLIIAILFGGGGFGFGGGRGPMPDVATKEFVQDSVNNQAVQSGLRDILLSSANNNYEVAQRINDQTNTYLMQNNANQITFMQTLGALSSKLDQLGFNMEQCCCRLETQQLRSQYEEALRELNKAYTDKSNADQTAYLLSVMGKWQANPAATTA